MIGPREPLVEHWFLVELAWNVRATIYCAGDHPDYAPDYPGDEDLRAIALSALVAHILSNPGDDLGLVWATWNTTVAGVLGVPTDTLKPLKDEGRVEQLWVAAVRGLVLSLSEPEPDPLDPAMTAAFGSDLRQVEMV